MNRIIGIVNTLSRTVTNRLHLRIISHDHQSMVEQVVDESSFKIDNKEIKVNLDALVNYQVMSNHSALTTVLRNTLGNAIKYSCLLYTSPSPRDQRGSRMPSSA